MSYQPPNEQPWQQPPNTSYPPQQPFQTGNLPPSPNQPYQPYPQQPMYPLPPIQQPPKKKRGTLFWLLLLAGIVIGFGLLSVILTIILQTPSTPVLSEGAYKDSSTFTTVSELDKDGNSDQGKIVHFTCKILKFVKDSNGNTAGANVEPSDVLFGPIIQISFPNGTDLSQLNENDTLEVWGTDNGVFSGPNAFGATVQEVGITAVYMTDQTTGYSTK